MKHLTLAVVIGALSTSATAATYDLPFKGQNFGDHEKVHTFDHAQNHSQKHGFDMGARRYDFDNSRWTSVTTTVADYNAAPTNNKFAVYNKPIYAMQAGKVALDSFPVAPNLLSQFQRNMPLICSQMQQQGLTPALVVVPPVP